MTTQAQSPQAQSPQALTPQAIALNRFGLGARPGDRVPDDPKRWLLDQFDRFTVRPEGWPAPQEAREISETYALAKAAMRGKPLEERQGPRRDLRLAANRMEEVTLAARLRSAAETTAPFIERLTHFWSNHFAISTERAEVDVVAGSFELEAIRAHVLGRFEDMLQAVEHHPAMLIYLDQVLSIGPHSPLATRVAERGKTAGLNENLGREILELHTLGVRTGYTQADVTENALALTGWTVGGYGSRSNDADPFAFQFRAVLHEPGTRTILGQRFDQPGEGQAKAVLTMLARAPATATHVATKLARHFAGDDPPPAMVGRLADAFNRSGGDLPTVYRALIDSPEAWVAQPTKFKSPWDWTVSAARALGPEMLAGLRVVPTLTELGQPIWKPGAPAGYDDINQRWAGPDALLRRAEMAPRFASPFGDELDARTLAPKLMPGSLSPGTATALARAESATSALSLLLVSPDFLRR
jgi:uncharacterized protein (DUF1800 family)